MAEPATDNGAQRAHPPLKPQEQLFVAAYMLSMDASKAAVAAGYSPTSAKVTGFNLLRRPRVAEAITMAMTARTTRTRIDADALLQRLAEEADADVSDLFDDDGGLKPISQWPRIWRKGLVAAIEVEAIYEGSGKDRVQVGTLSKIKLSDRVKRLELIGRHVGVQAFRDKVQHDVSDPLKELLAQLQGRGIKPADGDKPSPSAPGIIRPKEG